MTLINLIKFKIQLKIEIGAVIATLIRSHDYTKGHQFDLSNKIHYKFKN